MVGVRGAELELEPALHVDEDRAGVGESGKHVAHRRMVPRRPPARIRHPQAISNPSPNWVLIWSPVGEWRQPIFGQHPYPVMAL